MAVTVYVPSKVASTPLTFTTSPIASPCAAEVLRVAVFEAIDLLVTWNTGPVWWKPLLVRPITSKVFVSEPEEVPHFTR